MNGRQIHPTSIFWIIRLGASWGNARILLQTATEAKNSSQVYTLADLVCVACLVWKPLDNAVKDNCNWLRACVPSNGGNF